MFALTRRGLLLGGALAACSRATAQGLPRFASSSAEAREHWTARYLGYPPVGMLATRFAAPKRSELPPLFVRWEGPGLQIEPPPSLLKQEMPFGYSAMIRSPDVELFRASNGATIAVLRGVPPDIDPFVLRCFTRGTDPCGYRLADFSLVGTSPSGVMQARSGQDTLLFRLPDRTTWVSASGSVALRLADALAKSPTIPPSERHEPSATVAQLVLTDVARGPLLPPLLGGESLRAVGSYAYPAAPGGAEAPVALRLYFDSASGARDGAAELQREFARIRAAGSAYADRFPTAGSLSLVEETVSVRGTIPVGKLAAWCA